MKKIKLLFISLSFIIFIPFTSVSETTPHGDSSPVANYHPDQRDRYAPSTYRTPHRTPYVQENVHVQRNSVPIVDGPQDYINQAVQMLLNHGITGLILLILGWWYYKRQATWDKESAEMRKELMTYVKDDQESDYKFIQKLDQLCDEVARLRDEVQYFKK